jgi:hypothetical protein
MGEELRNVASSQIEVKGAKHIMEVNLSVEQWFDKYGAEILKRAEKRARFLDTLRRELASIKPHPMSLDSLGD